MTQVLTPQKAAELLKELQYAKAQMGQLSIKDEYFKQALERVVAGVPDGWKLVPVEPTLEMRKMIHPIAEGTCQHCYATVNPDCEDNVLYSWEDMLKAAPEAPL